MSLIDSAARPSSSSADLQGQGKAAICPPPRAKPRAKMDAVWRSRGAILRGEQVKDRKPQRRKRKPQRRGRELRPLPRPCADRDRPWARSLYACGMRGCGGGVSTLAPLPPGNARPASGFVKAFFVGGRERFAINNGKSDCSC